MTNTSRSNPVPALAHLFRTDRAARPVLLLGAGASYKSGVPLADEATLRIVRTVLLREQGVEARIRPTDIDAFLRKQDWFQSGGHLAEAFPLAVRNLLVPREFRRQVLLQLVSSTGDLSGGYVALGNLVHRGLIKTLLTTNFDRCIATAFEERRPRIRHFNEVGRFSGDIAQLHVYPEHPQIVYLHGTVEDYSDRNTDEEIQWIDELVSKAIAPIIEHSPLVVVGYRGAEPSVMDQLLMRLAANKNPFRNGLYWCVRPTTDLHPRVVALQERVRDNFVIVEIDGFDELMTSLAEALREEDSYRIQTSSVSAPARSWDEEPVNDGSLASLDLGAALVVLTEYCARLQRPTVTPETLNGLLTDLVLLRHDSTRETPSLAGLLLFGVSPQDHVPHCVVEVLRDGRRFRVVGGNLKQQFEQLVEILSMEEINPIVKLKKAATWDYRQAYPARALNELLVNMLVHRDYSVAKPARISVFPGDRIEFLNAGGLPHQAASKVEMAQSGQFSPKRAVTAIRNPGLADVFTGWGRMEKAGSGLVDTEELVRQNGGDALFFSEDNNSVFRAVLYQPRQTERKKQATALPRTPFGLFVTNHLRFLRVPETVRVADAADALNSEEYIEQGVLAGFERRPHKAIVIKQKSRLITFSAPAAFGVSAQAVREIPVSDFLQLPGGRSGFVWLLREHFVSHLLSLAKDGLILAADGHRAYFRRLEADKTTIYYRGETRQVRRDVVKRREGAKEPWHENEGIGFSAVEFDGHWAIQVKPFYMFTGEDGITPLSGLRRISLSTRRIKFDRNANVLSDLNFWAKFLAKGAGTIELSPSKEYQLVLNATFEQFEAIEEKVTA